MVQRPPKAAGKSGGKRSPPAATAVAVTPFAPSHDGAASGPIAQGDAILAAPTVTVTWDGVKLSLGSPTADDRAMYAVDETPEERLALGRRIASAKILTDFLRWLGDVAAWVARTPKEGLDALVGFSVGHVQVALEEGLRLRSLLAHYEGRSLEAELEQGGADVGLESAAKVLRAKYDALYTAVEHATRNDAVLSGKVTTAFSKAVKPKPLAAAVALFAPLAREAIGRKGRIGARLAREHVTLAVVESLEKAGAELSTADAQSGRTAGGVTERDLDLQDGTCIVHMQWLYEFFGNLHDADPSAPRLVPIATRSIFGGHKSPVQAPADAPAGAQPAEVPAKKPV
jgi:hypothetical protein